jgi:hypothetical protein
MTEPRKNAPKTRGRPFEQGNPGKPKGARHKVTLLAEAAKAGDLTAANDLTPQPTPTEAAAIEAAVSAVRSRRPRVAVETSAKGDVLQIDSPHSDEDGLAVRLVDAFGTESADFSNHAIARLGAVVKRKGAALPTQRELNAGLAAIDGLKPRDEIEAMLALQMVATHETAMEMLTRAKQAEFMPQLQECGSLAVKLMRTYTAQVEALARLRRGGEQRVIVQHVNVNEGGQAIVGAVNHPGGTENER